MDRFPIPARRRLIYETAIRVLDLIVYTAILAGGVYALVSPPDTVRQSLEGYEWLAISWSVLLASGGLVGLIGRFTGYWLIETPATIASATGILIYTVILWEYAFTSITSAVATALVLVAFASMVRRWMELQLFGSEPHSTWRDRWRQALLRQIPLVVPRINS